MVWSRLCPIRRNDTVVKMDRLDWAYGSVMECKALGSTSSIIKKKKKKSGSD